MLPINTILPELQQTLEHQCSVLLQAPPGAGKTTRVPLALLDAPWRSGRKILMLEPVAGRPHGGAVYGASAGRKAGQTVGYRTRLDSQISATTDRVVTEGILTLLIQQDPLEGYACGAV